MARRERSAVLKSAALGLLLVGCHHLPRLPPAGYVGFVFGLACGSIVLTWLYNRTGGSILACAVWHGLFNLATGTAAATGTIQGVASTFVYSQALILVGLELRARRRGEASILGPRRGDAPSSRGPVSATW